MTKRNLPKVVGMLVGLAGLVFVADTMWSQREEISDVLARSAPAWLVVALVVGVCGMTVIGLSWWQLVRHLGGTMPVRSALRGYFVGQLGKYVPGGVWQVLGRGEWARQAGVSGAVAYSSTMLSMITAYVAGSLVAGASLLVSDIGQGNPWIIGGVVALGPLGLLGLHPAIMGWALGLVRRITGRTLAVEVLPWGRATGIVALQAPAWIGIGTATWLVSVALGGTYGWREVMLATCVSWVAGFLFLPVPGGIGIREAVFVAVLGTSPVAAAVALAARLLFVAVDLVGAGTSTGVNAWASRAQTTS